MHYEEEAAVENEQDIGGLHDAIHDTMNHDDYDDFINSIPNEVHEEEQIEDLFVELKQSCTLVARIFHLYCSWYR